MKEKEIRDSSKHEVYLQMVREDARRFFPDPQQFIEVPCSACESGETRIVLQKDIFTYVQCAGCDSFYVNPRPTLKNLIEFYTDSPSTSYWVNDFFLPVSKARQEKIFRPRAIELASRFTPDSDTIIGDIGAGFGLFLEEMQNISKSKYLYAIEPSKEMAEICRNKGLRVIENPIESVSSQEYQFDLLTSFELLEHLFDPYSFILSVFSLLKPGGHFVLTTPNGLGFDIVNLWEKSKTIFPPHHLNFFNPSSLHKLFSRAGFQEIEVTTPGKLDWEIVEKAVEDAPRFFSYLSKYGSPDAKRELQSWITKYNFSSHMHVVARKPLC